MLSAQMPIYMADNSFNSKGSDMADSVEFDNSPDGKKFTDIYESAASIHGKEKNIDSNEGELVKRNSFKDPSEAVDFENEKLISLKKGKSSNLNRKNKSTNSRVLREKLTELSLTEEPGKSMKGKTPDMEYVVLDNSEKSIIPDQGIQNIDRDDVVKSVDINIAVNSSDVLVSEQSKSSIIIKSLNEEKSGKSEGRATEKSTVKREMARNQARISVLDLREPESRAVKQRQTVSTITMESQKLSTDQLEHLRSDSALDAKPIVIELTHVKDNFSGESKTLTTTTGSSLMKQLEESINNRIVKQSSVILKDSDSGEIKLILKPEALGKVRIRLSLNDNRIAGQIIVENTAVKEIFEQNLQNLEKTFKDNGFDTASLNVSVGGQNTGSKEREKSSDIAKQIEMIEEIIPTMITNSDNLIDLVV